MYFMIKDHELLEKYNKIQDKVCNIIKKEFDNEPIYNDKYPKIKLKFSKEKIKASFDKKPKEVSHCICLSVTLISSVFKMDKNLQVFLEQYK